MIFYPSQASWNAMSSPYPLPVPPYPLPLPFYPLLLPPTGIVGELSVQMGERLQQPDVPAKLALGTSLIACVMGFAWTAKALIVLQVRFKP